MSINVDPDNPQNVTATVFAPDHNFAIIREVVSTDAGASWKTVKETRYEEGTLNLTPQRPCNGSWQLHPSSDGLKLLGKTA